jgi:bifunctional non-homologous end joining protein LigD
VQGGHGAAGGRSSTAIAALRDLPLYFYAFDVLNRNGELLLNFPIERRRELLESLLAGAKDPLRLSPLLQAPTGQILDAVRKLGLEGLVGKRIDGSRNLNFTGLVTESRRFLPTKIETET